MITKEPVTNDQLRDIVKVIDKVREDDTYAQLKQKVEDIMASLPQGDESDPSVWESRIEWYKDAIRTLDKLKSLKPDTDTKAIAKIDSAIDFFVDRVTVLQAKK